MARKGWQDQVRVRLGQAALILLLVAAWELAARHGLYDARKAAPPSAILAYARALPLGELWVDLNDSVRRVMAGFAVACGIGISLAVAMTLFRTTRPYVEMLVELVRGIPPLAWIPLAILWFGVGEKPALFLVFLAAVGPIFVNVSAGLANVDPFLLDVARGLGMDRWMTFRRVQLPSLLPHFFAGMRAGLGIGWMAVVTCEMVGSQSGLGYRLMACRQLLDSEGVILVMIAVGLLGYALSALLGLVERLLLPWRRSYVAGTMR